MATQPFREGELLLLRRRSAGSLLVRLAPGAQQLEGLGVLDTSGLVGQAPGARLDWAGESYRAFRPNLSDRLTHLRRRAQIVLAKDALELAFLAGVGPGGVVLEAGAGSGALTTVLAYLVGPEGRVVSFDRRPDFLRDARRNVETLGLAERVEFREQDVLASGFGVTGADSIVLDLPEPWSAVAPARDALQPGGGLATYTPTYNQLERTVRAMRDAQFVDVRALELLERELHVGEHGTRPEFEMLGHTGFLAGARRFD